MIKPWATTLPCPSGRRAVSARSGEERDRPEPREGGPELERPGPARQQVQRDPTSRAGQPPGQSEQPPAERLGS